MQTTTDPEPDALTVKGADILDTIKHVVHEGNVRRITVKHDGDVVAEFPLTAGVVGAALAPAVAALGAMIALLSDCTIEIHREPAPLPPVDGEPIASA